MSNTIISFRDLAVRFELFLQNSFVEGLVVLRVLVFSGHFALLGCEDDNLVSVKISLFGILSI